MEKYKIVYDSKKCIGAGECEALSSELWKMQGNGKATLVGGVFDEASEKYVFEIDESQAKKQKLVAESCPVGCITLKKLQ